MASQQLNNLAMGLMGMGAGLQGNLPQFQQVQMQQQQLQQQQQERQAQAAAERQKTMFYDSDAALKLLESENYDALISLGMQRLKLLQNFPDADPSDTQRLTQLALAARNGEEEAKDLLKDELTGVVQLGRSMGILESPKEAEGYTLGKGDVRFDAQGNVIAENKDESAGMQASSPIGKLFLDHKNGLIPAEVFEAEVRKLGEDPTDAYIRQLEIAKKELEIQKEEQGLAKKEEDAANKVSQEESANRGVVAQAQMVSDMINDAKNLIDEAQSGRTGAAFAFLNPEGVNGMLRRKLQTIKSNIGFDKLMEMKRSSPTGGALGAVSERELSDLQATLGSLDAMASDDELLGALNNIQSVYRRIAANAGGDLAAPLNYNDLNNMSTKDLIRRLEGSDGR